MGILKIKEWANSKLRKQFKIIMIGRPSNLIIKVQRISDRKIFELDRCIYSRSVYIANELREFNVFISEFLSDETHVELLCKANDKSMEYPTLNKTCFAGIDYIEKYAEILADTVMMDMANSYKA